MEIMERREEAELLDEVLGEQYMFSKVIRYIQVALLCSCNKDQKIGHTCCYELKNNSMIPSIRGLGPS